MVNIRHVVPDLLDENTTQICSAPIETDQYLEGLPVKKDRCLMLYDESTRNEVLDEWEKQSADWFHLSGGWRNPMTSEYKFFRDLDGDTPFNERRVGDYKEHLPIEFDYMGNWREMVKNIDEEIFREMKISELLKQGAPPYWDLKANGEIIARCTSAPFPGTQFAMGYIVTELQPEFTDRTFSKNISNTTGARGFDTIAMNHLLSCLTHKEDDVIKAYLADANWRKGQAEKRGKTPPYAGKEEKYAEAFVETAGEVKDEIVELVSKFTKDEIKGFQYAAITYIVCQTPAGIYRFPESVSHAFVKTEEDWQIVER